MNKQLIKDFVPPALIKAIRKTGLFNSIQWSGNYASWEDAAAKSSGYDSELIVEKVKNALLKVKNGEAVYERDSVLFDEIEYTWPVLASLMWIYAQDLRLNIIDFGGSLGSTYFQNRKFLRSLAAVRWNIVEQKQFVDIGKKYFQDEQLKFYFDTDSCLKETNPNCILLSCVLPYIKDPYDLVDKLLQYNFKFLILDKMPFIEGAEDRLTIQKTPKSIYAASYPSWFFSESKLKSKLSERYEIVEEFLCKDEATIKSTYKGIVLKLK